MACALKVTRCFDDADFEAIKSEVFIDEAKKCRVGFTALEDHPGLGPAVNDTVLQENKAAGASQMLIIRRDNSWSRLNVTSNVFYHLYNTLEIDPQFLKIIGGFQRRWSSHVEDIMRCYGSATTATVNEGDNPEMVDGTTGLKADYLSSDICYSIYHFELHGRALDDPWSCRQSAIYQKYSSNNARSDFIIIQPPARFSSYTTGQPHPMTLHLEFISACISNWQNYMNYVSKRLEPCLFADLSSFFWDRTWSSAFLIVVNTINLLNSLRRHANALQGLAGIPHRVQAVFNTEVCNIVGDLKAYKQVIQKQILVSGDLEKMYDDVLRFHGQEMAYTNNLKLTAISEAGSVEAKTMAWIANETYRDSRSTRIMTVIALAYLPANLVLSFFSTSFVWFESRGEPNAQEFKGFSLRVHDETWIAVLITLILASITMDSRILL
ncbi:uncharacterized protein B0J16DRAFT_392732 [Fusarium flagelliforme]|uniref:uncharacterized protein n=1 Tax=Fusarium flagelliforme TaxID=2675880 RepID=UPI001E8DCB1A|nr:uncharacterized protein B0J16DRAFT_392732 [Fusarium flagelliforme]KAH7198913.1 hypothetical protein B0J16DRAFT_392732 [Fusarium flagelliforme]